MRKFPTGFFGVLMLTVLAGCSEQPKKNACHVDGKSYDEGERFTVQCNTCACHEDGSTTCTKKYCGP